MFAQLGPEKLSASSSAQLPLDTVMTDGVRGDADVGVLATRGANGRVAILLWHYHDDDLPGADAAISMNVQRVPRHFAATLWRVDGAHANAFAAWKAMGSPQSPNATQYAELEKASELVPETLKPGHRRGAASFEITVPRQGVALLLIDPVKN
jgi:xylan 1,4-beta-xylosidase